MSSIDDGNCESTPTTRDPSKGEIYLWMFFSSLFCFLAVVLNAVACLLLTSLFIGVGATSISPDDDLMTKECILLVTIGFLSIIVAIMFAVLLKVKTESAVANCRAAIVAVFVGLCVGVFWLVIFSIGALVSPAGLFLAGVALFSVPDILLLLSAWKERDLGAKRKGLINSTMLSMAIISIMLAVFMPIAQELGSSDQVVCSCDQCVSRESAMRDD